MWLSLSKTKSNYIPGKIVVKDGVDTENGIYKIEVPSFLHNEDIGTIVTGNMKVNCIRLVNIDQNIDYGYINICNGVKFGSSKENTDMFIKDDDCISKVHCKLFIKNMIPYICDMGSKNGTFVNERKITNETRLNNNDILRIGKTHFKVFLIQQL